MKHHHGHGTIVIKTKQRNTSNKTTSLSNKEKGALAVVGTILAVGYVSFKLISSIFGASDVHAQDPDAKPKNSISVKYDEGFMDYWEFEEKLKLEGNKLGYDEDLSKINYANVSNQISYEDNPQIDKEKDQAMRRLQLQLTSPYSSSSGSNSSGSSNTSSNSTNSSTTPKNTTTTTKKIEDTVDLSATPSKSLSETEAKERLQAKYPSATVIDSYTFTSK